MTAGNRKTRSRGDAYQFPVPISLVVVFLLLLGFVWYWVASNEPSPTTASAVVPLRDTNGLLPQDLLVEGEHYPLPEEGTPLPGRPDVVMPIPKQIYSNVELKLDGKIVESPVVLAAGKHVSVEGDIIGNPDLHSSVIFDGGLAFVTRADNERGWIFRHHKHFHSNTSNRRCRFDGEFTLPNEPGEYVLIVLSSAELTYITEKLVPWLIAAEYDLTLE